MGRQGIGVGKRKKMGEVNPLTLGIIPERRGKVGNVEKGPT